MNQKIMQIIKQIEKLSEKDREILFLLIEDFGLADLSAEEGVEEAWEAELEKRLKEVDDGTAKLYTIEECDQELDELFAQYNSKTQSS